MQILQWCCCTGHTECGNDENGNTTCVTTNPLLTGIIIAAVILAIIIAACIKYVITGCKIAAKAIKNFFSKVFTSKLGLGIAIPIISIVGIACISLISYLVYKKCKSSDEKGKGNDDDQYVQQTSYGRTVRTTLDAQYQEPESQNQPSVYSQWGASGQTYPPLGGSYPVYY
jgi:heme/copper-type cytochrome/quinol oxidase subunit 2